MTIGFRIIRHSLDALFGLLLSPGVVSGDTPPSPCWGSMASLSEATRREKEMLFIFLRPLPGLRKICGQTEIAKKNCGPIFKIFLSPKRAIFFIT